jgi:hypothetical protein
VNASILEKPGNRFTDPQMRAHLAGKVEGHFQLCQRLPNIRRANGAEQRCRIHCRQYQPDPREQRRSGSRSIPDRQNLNEAGLFLWGLRTPTRYRQGNRAAR